MDVFVWRLLLYFSYLGAPGLSGHGSAPDVGWFAYGRLPGARSLGDTAPITGFSHCWSAGSAACSAVNVIVYDREHGACKGMTLMRIAALRSA